MYLYLSYNLYLIYNYVVTLIVRSLDVLVLLGVVCLAGLYFILNFIHNTVYWLIVNWKLVKFLIPIVYTLFNFITSLDLSLVLENMDTVNQQTWSFDDSTLGRDDKMDINDLLNPASPSSEPGNGNAGKGSGSPNPGGGPPGSPGKILDAVRRKENEEMEKEKQWIERWKQDTTRHRTVDAPSLLAKLKEQDDHFRHNGRARVGVNRDLHSIYEDNYWNTLINKPVLSNAEKSLLLNIVLRSGNRYPEFSTSSNHSAFVGFEVILAKYRGKNFLVVSDKHLIELVQQYIDGYT